MAGFTKVNPVGGIVLGTLYSTLQLKAFKVVIRTANALTGGLDTYDTNVTGDLVAQEIGTTGALFQIAADGEEMVIVGDGHALDVDALAQRIGNILLSTGAMDGAGVWKTAVGGTTVVTVTQLSSFASLMA